MKKVLTLCVALAALTYSCGNSGQKQSENAASEDSVQTVATNVVIDGKWNIENVVVNDSLYARPSEETPDKGSNITFDNGNYAIATNCNQIQGSYKLNGDSIIMEAGLCTEMACDNMRVEDLIKQVLPTIRTVDQVNDSTLRLNSEASEYILLSKVNEPVKE